MDAAAHASLISELVVTEDESFFDDLGKYKSDRKALQKRILEIMMHTEKVKSMKVKNTEELKSLLVPTMKHKDVLAAQTMLFQTANIPAPPAMLGVVWCL